MTDAAGTAAERKADTLARLDGDAYALVATASAGRPHLVPLSLAWDGPRVIAATPPASLNLDHSQLLDLLVAARKEPPIWSATLVAGVLSLPRPNG